MKRNIKSKKAIEKQLELYKSYVKSDKETLSDNPPENVKKVLEERYNQFLGYCSALEWVLRDY